MTLLILAAGLGSRYGGLKQLDGIGPNGELIIEYSIYDAYKAGFSKVVFLIREEHKDIFHEKIGKKASKFINVEYAFQNNNNVPKEYNLPKDRKPLGTGHAVLCAKDNIGDDDFVVINADDFYGRNSFVNIIDYMKSSDKNEHCLVAYQLKNTISENGTVSRGVCFKDENNYLSNIVEHTNINSKYLNEVEPIVQLKEDTYVSMNFWGFRANIFEVFEKCFKEFLEYNKNDLQKCEYYLTIPPKKCIDENISKIKVIETTSSWYGVTYQEDKAETAKSISELTNLGIYPNNLWQ